MDSLDFHASWKNQKKLWLSFLSNWFSLFGFESFTIQRPFQAKSVPTKRAPDAGDSAAISSSFLRLSIFLAGRLRRPRPSAGNANR